VDLSDNDLTFEQTLEPALAAFAQAYIRRIPDERVAGLTDDKLFAEMRSTFDFTIARAPGETAVRVFNPDIAADGYDPGRTVVDIVVDDAPFLVDSVRSAIEASGHVVTLDVHAVIGVERDAGGRLIDIGHALTSPSRESVQHYVLERTLNAEECVELKARVISVLRDVQLSVRDFDEMQGTAVDRMIAIARQGQGRYGEEVVTEAIEFLAWLRDLNYVFLGYREYAIVEDGGEPALMVVPGSGLGVMSETDRSKYARPVALADLPVELQQRYEEGFLVVVAKTNRTSTVHRPARMDYIGVRMVGPGGAVVGEARMIGLFTSHALMAEPSSIPMLRGKLKEVLEAEDMIEGSHDYRAVVKLFNSFPQSELWSMPVEAIRTAIQGYSPSSGASTCGSSYRPAYSAAASR
jgi:glutamate dehydrogenase